MRRFIRWSLGFLLLVAVLVSTGCPPSLAGDWGCELDGAPTSGGWVGFEVNGKLFSVDVEAGETLEKIGPRLTAVMKAAGLVVDCERFAMCESYEWHDGQPVGDEPCYTFILRDIDGPPEHKSQAPGIGGGSGGPLIDDRILVENAAKSFFHYLNTNNKTWMRRTTTQEFFYEHVSDLMASVAANGEQVIIESMEEPTISCHEASISLHLMWVAGTEQQHVDAYLTLSGDGFWEWLVSGMVIR